MPQSRMAMRIDFTVKIWSVIPLYAVAAPAAFLCLLDFSENKNKIKSMLKNRTKLINGSTVGLPDGLFFFYPLYGTCASFCWGAGAMALSFFFDQFITGFRHAVLIGFGVGYPGRYTQIQQAFLTAKK